MRSLTLILIGLIAMFPSIVCGGAQVSIKIGALYNLTGSMSPIDLPGANGAKLAAKLINKNGGLLGGRKIQLVTIDTKTDLKLTKKAAEKLVREGVAAALGYGDTNYVIAAGPVFQKQGIPFVTSGATDPTLPSRVGPELFLAAYGDNGQADAMAEYAFTKRGVKSVALLTQTSSDFTKALAKYFKQHFRQLGGEIVAEEKFKEGDKDLSGKVARIKGLNPPAAAIFVSGQPADVAPTVTPLRKAGITAPILSGDGFASDVVKDLGDKRLSDNIYFSTHVFLDSKSPHIVAFVKAYRAEYGRPPENSFAALGFDTVNLIASAISRAGTADPAAVTKALAETKGFKGVTGKISYSPGSRVPIKSVCIEGIKDGQYHLVWTWEP